MKKILLLFIAFILVSTLTACVDNFDCDVTSNTSCASNDPVIAGETVVNIVLGGSYVPLDGVTAYDTEDGDLTGMIVVGGDVVDVNSEGVYIVTLSVTDSDENINTVNVTVYVGTYLANYPDGIDLSNLSGESKASIYAALESYLLNSVSGGVPLYRNAIYSVYSSRTELYTETSNAIFGFGNEFSILNEDDSTVLMYGDVFGNANEYTWRDAYESEPSVLNFWISDDSRSSELIRKYTGSLYEFQFNDTDTGYNILPSLALDKPLAINGELVDGKIESYVWQIPLRNDLTWKYHPNTDISGFDIGHEIINAEDYLWTWKTALENEWFEAVSGGGDFIGRGVVNADAFSNGLADWSDVGLRMAEGESNVLEIEFDFKKSEHDVLYMFSRSSLSPINQGLFESLGETGYGVSPETVASSGVYYFDQWISSELIAYKKNELHPDSDMYHYTGLQYTFIDGTNEIFDAFLEGKLDSADVPNNRYAEVTENAQLMTIPQQNTWSLHINGFGTVENRDAHINQYPGDDLQNGFVPEPILGYLEMKQALYYGFDRYTVANDMLRPYVPTHTYFPDSYLFDNESGITVRGTDNGLSVVSDFGGDTNGYFPDDAVDLFKQAVTKGINDGYYSPGTIENPTIISLDFSYASSGNINVQNMAAEIKRQYEELLYDDVNNIGVEIIISDYAFPANYYNYLLIANCDLGLGSVDVTHGVLSILDYFRDDNRSESNLDFGIDTHSPNIEVTYEDLNGEIVTEIWSYNALSDALFGKIYIKDGVEQSDWEDSADLINTYLDMTGEVFESSSNGVVIAEYLFRTTLVDIADSDSQIDSLEAYIILSVSGESSLYVLSVKDGKYQMYMETELFSEAIGAIENHAGYPLIAAERLMTDADVAANEYLNSLGNIFTTIAQYSFFHGAPYEYVELWATDFGWLDAYIVLHIGEYYIGWAWL